MGMAAGVANVLACVPPDCDHPDLGSCGNACCLLEIDYQRTCEDVQTAIAKHLESGGPDGRWQHSWTSDGTISWSVLDPPYKGWSAIGQYKHLTAKYQFVDTINFNLKGNATSCTLRAFSISGIAGALGDGGQNFKNLASAMRSFGPDLGSRGEGWRHVGDSCQL